ncbi:N-acyl-D-amino-acid deacylase family protein [Zavarzinia sp. CC-PAN008]|uniref:N-acyl-D-amino-acid deacylase family protein n=1 Tax=Zavarzinia sp. CC-PAN008 TaxID=3243332 RepID=UPI003F7495E0
MADLVIRGGTIFDGTGGEPFVADIAITGGRIVTVGTVSGTGREEIDATGKMVTPGFIDVHTHYDGQLIWASHMSPSSAHGVTTVVTGNCGVGFAPCRPEDHTRLIKLLEGVEDMPEIVLADGLTWDWETFPEFIQALKRRKHDIDFAVQLPHAALRMYVMGERAVDMEVATDEDMAQMRAIAKEAIQAGAIGLGTSRNIFHTTLDGVVIPTAHTPEPELRAIAEGMAEGGGGVIQAILNIEHPKPDLEMFHNVATHTGSPLSFSLLQTSFDKNNWKEILETVRVANDGNGPRVTAQVFARPVGVLLGLDASYNPFSAHPAYCAIADLPLAERVAEMRKPEVRAAIIADTAEPRGMFVYAIARRFETIYALGATPNYEPDPANSVAALAAARGVSPDEVVYDMLLEQDGHALLLQTAANFEENNLDAVHGMLTHPHSVPALGDGGAHYGMICDSTYTTFMLTYWGRDRQAARIALPEIIGKMTAKPAAMLGFTDRGRIAEGLKADLNVIDFDKLTLHVPRMVRDLPSNGRRLTQDADGYVATIVSGEVIMRNGQPTGALPGRMVERPSRGARALAAE